MDDYEHPIERANVFSRMLLHWLQPLISLGAKQTLEQEDIPAIGNDWKTKKLCEDFEPFWEYEKNNGKSSLVRALIQRFKYEFMFSCTILLGSVLGMVISPFMVGGILTYINEPESYAANPVWGIKEGYQLVILMATAAISQTLCVNNGFTGMSLMGTKVRSTLMGKIYRKALRLSSNAQKSEASAENLMSNDAERVFISLLTLNILYIGVVLVIAVGGMLIASYGLAGGVGVALTIVIAPIQSKMAKDVGVNKRAMLKESDKRVKFTNEVINGINVVKINAWEDQFLEKINDIRRVETSINKKILSLIASNVWLLYVIPKIVATAVFVIYIATGNTLTVDVVYTVLVYINILRIPIAVIPRAIADVSQSLVSLQRIQKFLLLEEQPNNGSNNVTTFSHGSQTESTGSDTSISDSESTVAIQFKNASFAYRSLDETKEDVKKRSWCCGSKADKGIKGAEVLDATPNEKAPISVVLKDINLTINHGELVAIVGTVGSGKTSLVNAILGEIEMIGNGQSFVNPYINGARNENAMDLSVQAPIAFVAQEAWIQNESLRNNILFRSALFENQKLEGTIDEDLLNKAVQSAQLKPDLKMLPQGIETEIGNRGINLSGGQKQRVSLARAIYRACRFDLDMIIFDDPFSALDPQVAENVFEETMFELLDSKTRIIVLNSHLHMLEKMDKVLVMDDGKLVGCGSPNEVLAQFEWLSQRAKAKEAEEAEPLIDESKGDVNKPVRPKTESEVVNKEDDGKLYGKEDREEGAVKLNNYIQWVASGVGEGKIAYITIIAIVSMFVFAQVFKTGSEYWLGYWATPGSPVDDTKALYVYFIIIALMCSFQLMGTLSFITLAVKSAYNLHDKLINSLLRAPINLFFDVVPTGRIVNRFSSDIEKVDGRLGETALQLLGNVVQVLGALIVCLMASYYFLIVFIPLSFVFGIVAQLFAKSSREVKRLEGISRSPIFSCFGESLSGISTIRAFSLENYSIQKCDSFIDRNASSFFTFWVLARYLAVRIDLIAIVVQVSVSCFAVFYDDIDANTVSLALSQSLTLLGMLQFTIRLVIETENYMTSVERVIALSAPKIPQEAPAEIIETRPKGFDDHQWPVGQISIQNLKMRYRPHLDLVLKGVSVDIPAQCKVGVVGRTGSGKSTLFSCFFRLIDQWDDGTVHIDGVNVSKLGLKDLRSRLSIIPQNPTIFSGSVRFNVDPFETSTDAEIWTALERVQLAEFVRSLPHSLDEKISSKRLSVGQSQLLSIARTIVKSSKIVLMDEATANVDKKTDTLIQTAIKKNLKDCTVITIAHRINTIIESDLILVFDFGRLKEYGTPSDLIAQEGIFADMVKTSTMHH